MAITAPPVAGLVARPRLFAMLDAPARVTLVCAPAGSGKTMLLSSWLDGAQDPLPVAWVSVEREESDATRFWGMVMDAFRTSGGSRPTTRSRRWCPPRSAVRRSSSSACRPASAACRSRSA